METAVMVRGLAAQQVPLSPVKAALHLMPVVLVVCWWVHLEICAVIVVMVHWPVVKMDLFWIAVATLPSMNVVAVVS